MCATVFFKKKRVFLCVLSLCQREFEFGGTLSLIRGLVWKKSDLVLLSASADLGTLCQGRFLGGESTEYDEDMCALGQRSFEGTQHRLDINQLKLKLQSCADN